VAENDAYKNFLEVRRWLVFIFIIIPLIPVAVVSAILGSVWELSKECFLAGASVFNVWGDDKQEQKAG
jgi:hypothetical protein